MTDDRTNENEGADPSSDIEKQNRGDGGGTGESRAGAGEGDDADSGAQDRATGGPDDVDPDAGQQ